MQSIALLLAHLGPCRPLDPEMERIRADANTHVPSDRWDDDAVLGEAAAVAAGGRLEQGAADVGRDCLGGA